MSYLKERRGIVTYVRIPITLAAATDLRRTATPRKSKTCTAMRSRDECSSPADRLQQQHSLFRCSNLKGNVGSFENYIAARGKVENDSSVFASGVVDAEVSS
jgi:hypothetical protein